MSVPAIQNLEKTLGKLNQNNLDINDAREGKSFKLECLTCFLLVQSILLHHSTHKQFQKAYKLYPKQTKEFILKQELDEIPQILNILSPLRKTKTPNIFKRKHPLVRIIDSEDKSRTLAIAAKIIDGCKDWRDPYMQQAADIYAHYASEPTAKTDETDPGLLLNIAHESHPELKLSKESRYNNSITALNSWLDNHTSAQAADYLCQNEDAFENYLRVTQAPELKAVYERFAMSVFEKGIENYTSFTAGGRIESSQNKNRQAPNLAKIRLAYNIISHADSGTQKKVNSLINSSITKVYKENPSKTYAVNFAQAAVSIASALLKIPTAQKTAEIIVAHESLKKARNEVAQSSASFAKITKNQTPILTELGIITQTEGRKSITLEQMNDQT